MLLVFALSFFATALYEELWRRVAWNAGYIWGYHGFTLPFWVMAFLVGGLAGLLMNRSDKPVPFPGERVEPAAALNEGLGQRPVRYPQS